MHIIHELIWVPKISQNDLDKNTSLFEVWPLPRGYGVTLANSLRRVLLSSIPGTKITWIKVKWVSHEYSNLPGVKDSVLDIILNLKDLVIEKKEEGIEWIKLNKNTSWNVVAWDIKTPSWIKVLNKDLYITSIDKDWLELNIDIRIEKNVWYKSIEDLKEEEDDVNVLIIDANFSPVLNVKYNIEKTRNWDISNLENLQMEILTNWAIAPVEAIKFSANMLVSYFSLFNEKWLQVEWNFISNIQDLLAKEKEEIKVELEKETYTPIEIMWLSPRTLNALINWNILSVEQLTKCTETKLGSIKWFGKKAMTEIRDSLSERSLGLLGDD